MYTHCHAEFAVCNVLGLIGLDEMLEYQQCRCVDELNQCV